MAKPSFLFVCLGNICRSPLAEAALRAEALRVGLDLDIESAGIGDWHVGAPPDRRARAVALRHGIDIGGYRARQVQAADFRRFTDIVALDRQNLAALEKLRPSDGIARLSLLLDAVRGREGEAVADPYWGGEPEFARTWADVRLAAEALAKRVLARQGDR
jgi:protein-tyrosine phosphatase